VNPFRAFSLIQFSNWLLEAQKLERGSTTRNHCRFLVAGAVAALTLFGLATAWADDADLEKIKAQLKAQIDAQVNEMKKDYEARIENLEKRIDSLESDNARLKRQATKKPVEANSDEVAALKNRVKVLETSARKTSMTAAATDQRATANAEAIEKLEESLHEDDTETQDRYRDDGGWPFDVTKLYDLPRPFEFHGYLRSGFGLTDQGGKMEAFKAPGAGAKFRLGNEADTYGEAALVNNWLRQDDPLASPYVRTTVRVSFSTLENFSYDSLNNQAQGNDFALREAFVEAGNVFPGEPDIKFWAGQRFYMRHDIHIDDFYYLDMSGYGAGVQDVPLGETGKLALAWLGGSVDNYQTDNGNVAKQNIDLRIYDVKALWGDLTFWFDYSNTKGGDVRNVFNPDGSPLSIQTSGGWAIGLIHRTEEEKFFGGYNEATIQYGEGAAYNFASTLDTSGPDLSDAWRFRVTDSFTIQPSPHFAMQALGLYEDTKFGGPNSRDRWISVGMRPVYFFNDRFSVALEAGIDWAKSEPLGTDGHLWKITFAPQISRGNKFFSRPVLRAFVTYAGWSDGFKGLIGGTPFEHATDGFSYGVQAEAWW
jgi:maltoporin